MLVAVYPEEPSAILTDALLAAGYRPVPVGDAAAVADREPETGWTAVIIELGSDPVRGLATVRRVSQSATAPVLVIADRTTTTDLAASPGIDDFVLTPIDGTELAMRLARLTPEGNTGSGSETIQFKDLALNTATYQATLAGSPVDLTYMEYELLRFFATNIGRVWSREQILSKVWDYDYFGGSRTVDVHVRRLRAKLGEERASWITTVRSVGYRFG